MAAAADPRIRWIAAKTAQSFEIPDVSLISEVLHTAKNAPYVERFFLGDFPQALLLFLHRNEESATQREEPDGLAVSSTQRVTLCVDEPLPVTAKAVYFLRNNDDSAAEISSKSPELAMSFGELTPSILDDMRGALTELYLPALRGDTAAWGKTSPGAVRDFLAGLSKFTESIGEAARSIQSGIALRRPDANMYVADSPEEIDLAAMRGDTVRHYEDVVENWGRQIERILRERDPQQRKTSDDSGPDAELEYWRSRMASFNSVTDQLRSPECRIVLAVLQTAKSAALRHWRQVDARVTDAANEAKDNVKYLATLEKHTKPLYYGTPLTIVDSLSGLMNNVKMMHSIARYYNTSERMTTLFVRFTNQMITNCREYINADAASLWEQPPEKLLAKLRAAIKLNEEYQRHYRSTKDELLAQPHGRQFDFSENLIFGKFELFCRRLQKLIDMFSTVQQFSSLVTNSIEGLDLLVRNFFQIVEEFKKKPYDLLDYTKNQFDRDFLEFNLNISELENALQSFINASFESISSTEHALALLKQYQEIMHRDNLRRDLDKKYLVIFHYYGLDLENVQKEYESLKQNPPRVRNVPPVVGNILWARQLLRRIEEPMRKFQENKDIMTTRESKRIIRTYNKVAHALVQFETLWHHAWERSVESARAGLRAPLLRRNGSDGELLVNFDRQILQLMRETRFMERLHVPVPDAARMVLLQESKFKRHRDAVAALLDNVARVTRGVQEHLRPLLQPHFDELHGILAPGLETLTWMSMNISRFLEQADNAVQRLQDMIAKISDITSQRINRSIRSIAQASLVDLPVGQTFSLELFVTQQEKIIKAHVTSIQQNNERVERAVGDIISLAASTPLDPSRGPRVTLDGEAVASVRSFYEELVYCAVLTATKNSFDLLRTRVSSASREAHGEKERAPQSVGAALQLPDAMSAAAQSPLFALDVQLTVPDVTLSPNLDEIQHAINRAALGIIRCSRKIYAWPPFSGNLTPKTPARATVRPSRAASTPKAAARDDWAVGAQPPSSASNSSEAGVSVGEASPAAQQHSTADASVRHESQDPADTDAGEASAATAPGAGPPSSHRAPPQSQQRGAALYDRISTDKDILKRILMLTGAVRGTRERVDVQLKRFSTYTWLWKDDKRASYNEFMKQSPSLDDFDSELHRFLAVEQAIETFPDKITVGPLMLDTEPIQASLRTEAVAWKRQYARNLHMQAAEDLERLLEYFKNTAMELDRKIQDLEDVRVVMQFLKEVRDLEAEIDSHINPVEEMYALLVSYGLEPPKAEIDSVDDLRRQWLRLKKLAASVSSNLAELQDGFKRDLVRSIKAFVVDVVEFRRDFEDNGPMVKGIRPEEAVERLKKYKRLYDIRERQFDIYSNGEELFGLPKTKYEELTKTKRELRLLDTLYSLYMDVITTVVGWQDVLWSDVAATIDAMASRMADFSTKCGKLNKGLREWDAYKELKGKIDSFNELLPLLQLMSHRAIRDRHWSQVEAVAGREFVGNIETLKLGTIIDVHLERAVEDVEEIANAAVKELAIETKLGEIRTEWGELSFTFANFKTRGPVILKGAETAEVIEKLEESQMVLASMTTSPYLGPFKDNVGAWVEKLATVSEVLDQWQQVQFQWMYLEAVFCSGDIAKQLPQEAKRFAKIDKNYMSIMTKAFETGNIVQYCCGNDVLKSMLPHLTEQLELCQRSLSGYLEQKRNAFPRFFFVSDPVLLEILSQGSDPHAIQKNLDNIFDSISRVAFDGVHKNRIMGMESSEGEEVSLSAPVNAEGNIEDWLTKLELAMRTTMRNVARDGAEDATVLELEELISKYPAQIGLLGIQILWTYEAEEALHRARSEKGVMAAANRKFNAMLRELSTMTTRELTKLDRTKIETLITIQVHQRDIFDELANKKKIRSPEDFEWLKQCRMYWKYDVDSAVVSISDVDFEYAYEYLGCKERLVITPLTDRCYITLAQALGMFLGGAPAGPAGTGKTETVKDMGRSLGKYVVVFNCSDQMSVESMARIFKGLCQSGAWGCFDEFNRIELEVLSVVAQQVLCVLTSIREQRESFVFTDGQVVTLDPKCGFFITMNPGYAGRQELPENLKVLFRGVAMMVPDRQIIIKVKLSSVGYLKSDILAKKFHVLYRLCEQQLSKQPHYDFGLRNILSVLRTAGAAKRSNPDLSEEVLLKRSLRDMNLSKFVADDVPLFLSLVDDLFPGIKVDKARYADVEAAIAAQIKDQGLQQHGDWVNKIVQLYETTLVRHGIMVVGPAGAGKSRCIDVLWKALRDNGTPHKEIRMNPKALTAQQMFGYLDKISNDWTDGVFSSLWRRSNQKSNKFNTWLVLDGPVDAIWIENLNTVLDDNKLLTLASGDRLPMTPNVKIMFEVEDLRNASLATVSRAGIIFISDSDLGWRPLVDSWLATRRASEADALRHLVDRFVEPTLDFLRRSTEEVMQSPSINRADTLTTLLSALLQTAAENGTALEQAQIERVFLYALCWSLGAFLEKADRQRFDEFLRTLTDNMPPTRSASSGSGDPITVFEFTVDADSFAWAEWAEQIPPWEGAQTANFSSLLIPTIDSVRIENLIRLNEQSHRPILLTGTSGTAKTSIVTMYSSSFSDDVRLFKRVTFSSATTPNIFQFTMEALVEKRQGRTFGPPGGRHMTVFLDDMSMPEINQWGDQETSEIVRQLVEGSGFYNLQRPDKGELTRIVDMHYIAAMNHPGGGKNDIPSRLKRHFSIVNVLLPSRSSIDVIYGSILRGFFPADAVGAEISNVVELITEATIALWDRVKAKMLPTPDKFHYQFNMRDISRVFQGIVLVGREVITSPAVLVSLWKHEAERVFADKLISAEDKQWYVDCAHSVAAEKFGVETADTASGPHYFVDFLRDRDEDADAHMDENEEDDADGDAGAAGNAAGADADDDDDDDPRVYEPAPSLAALKARIDSKLATYNENMKSKMNLVLFDDAVCHVARIARVLSMKRGSIMLVGVGGSGKQSLARLAAFVGRSEVVQLSVTKAYSTQNLFDDLKAMYKTAGVLGRSVAFVFTDTQIKDEGFLEYFNSILATGEVPGMIPKDELDMFANDLRSVLKKQRVSFNDSYDNLVRLFYERARDNLHMVLCFSPVGEKFRTRARKFPGIFNGCTIDWFLPWPQEALLSVADRFVGGFGVIGDEGVADALVSHMASVHGIVGAATEQYFDQYRRRVYVTPKSYLSFLDSYRMIYDTKRAEVQSLADRVNSGLHKLLKAEEDVERMKVKLQDDEVKLAEAQKETSAMLVEITASTGRAEKKKGEVLAQKTKIEAEAAVVQKQKDDAEADLAAARPALLDAEEAIKSINQQDITTLKQMKNPVPLIRSIFDAVILLLAQPIERVQLQEGKGQIYKDSWPVALRAMADIGFLKSLLEFDAQAINDETCELLEPYLNIELFNPEAAGKSSSAASGLCKWCRAMYTYHNVAKVVNPKIALLKEKEAELAVAQGHLQAAESEFAKAQGELDSLRAKYEEALAKKQSLEDVATATKTKINMANALMNGLAGEKERWTNDSREFADRLRRLAGDCAIAAAFLSYCGPFNQALRKHLALEDFPRDCRENNIPVSDTVDITSFLADEATVGEWNLQGLPSDELSVQNGILVTSSRRWPLLIDPQQQGKNWIKSREAENGLRVCELSDEKALRMYLEECLQFGLPLLVENVGEELDPILDNVLDQNYIQVGKTLKVMIGDKECDVSDNFRLYITTKLANPHYSPELSAKLTIIDFTVTLKGLEEQLLGEVISKERKELEEQRTKLLEDINGNQKKIKELENDLLTRLSTSKGDLLEDTSLIEVLANTKKTVVEVSEKLAVAADTEKRINAAREEYRPAAKRASVLYFVVAEMSLVNCMYQTSLDQFLELFDKSIRTSERSDVTAKRVAHIADCLTYLVYTYISRGLFERHKKLFVLLTALKIQLEDGDLSAENFNLFLKGGAALDIKTEKAKPSSWLPDANWLNVVEVGRSMESLRSLPDALYRNDSAWRQFYDQEQPEMARIPEYGDTLSVFERMVLIRALRPDRTMLVADEYIASTLGPRFIEPLPLNLEAVWSEADARTPVICLLSMGSDPSTQIDTLAKKKKKECKAVSMGQGQEVFARKFIATGTTQGQWVLLQNCHLGLRFLTELERTIASFDDVDPTFRLWITSEPHPQFPIGLLQTSIKITNEPPLGVKAGLTSSYAWIDQEQLIDAVDRTEWRSLLFSLALCHSLAQERRKFGPLGWNIPYEYNHSDLSASVTFLKNHFDYIETHKGQTLSWPTVKYMICEVLYGGKITDDYDRTLFNTYGDMHFSSKIFDPSFSFQEKYTIPQATEVQPFREYIASLPNSESPEVFGLHANADITYRSNQALEVLNTIIDTQPKESGGSSGMTREDSVLQTANDLLARTPLPFKADEVAEKIKRLGGKKLMLNVFLGQEVDRLQNVIEITRQTLEDLKLAIAGTIVMNADLIAAMNSIYDARVPLRWTGAAPHFKVSWAAPTLGVWFTGLLQRFEQINDWLCNGRPNSFWMTGFFNPQGFLTAIRQEVTRAHKGWALDDVVLHTEVTRFEREDVKDSPSEGVYVHGLFLEGCDWDRKQSRLVDSRPKVLFAPLPVLYVSAVLATDRRADGVFYQCPCYKTPKRTDVNFIFDVNLRSDDPPAKWVLRGAALLCTKDA